MRLSALLLAFAIGFAIPLAGAAGSSEQGICGNAPRSSSASAVTPELKEFLDSYESFMNEYVEFMKKYENADAADLAAMLNDYMDYMKKLTEFSEKADQYDQEQMSAADLSYYLEITNRINQKLLEAAA